MKSFTSILCGLAFLITISGCVQDQEPRYVRGSYRGVPRSPYIGSPEWITWVDRKVDTRYANGNRPDPGSQEWYAIVDHVVFTNIQKDYYRSLNRRDGRTSRPGSYRTDGKRYKIGTLEWKRAVDAEILSGRVPAPPPRSDPWDTPLAPTSDR